MEDSDLLNLQHDLERHEAAVTEDAKEIEQLKEDIRELLSLIQLLSIFVHRQNFGTHQDAASSAFNRQLQTILGKHGIALDWKPETP